MESNNNNKYIHFVNSLEKDLQSEEKTEENEQLLKNIPNLDYNSFELPPISEIIPDNFNNIFNSSTENLLNKFDNYFYQNLNNIIDDNLEYINNWEETKITSDIKINGKVLFNNLFTSPIKISPPIIKKINPYTHELKIKYEKKDFKKLLIDRVINVVNM
tara:strand:+ start:1799 stop:2278 length:480 start_codon:yes stop_codon:yes gene_type:complete